MITLQYGNKYFRLFAALIASIYVVLYGRFSEIERALMTPRFYIALLASFLIALFIIYAIQRITIWLDVRCSWRKDFWVRLMLQICVGILVPCCIDIILIHLYFLIFREDIVGRGFFGRDFIIVFDMLVVLNLYLGLYYWFSTQKWRKLKSEIKNEILEINYKNQRLNFDAGSDILYFIRDRKNVRFVTTDGIDFPVESTIKELIDKYQQSGFSQLNPGLIINCRIIHDYKNGIRRNTLEINIKPEYFSVVKNLTQDYLLVTKKYIDSFKIDLQNYIEKSHV